MFLAREQSGLSKLKLSGPKKESNSENEDGNLIGSGEKCLYTYELNEGPPQPVILFVPLVNISESVNRSHPKFCEFGST